MRKRLTSQLQLWHLVAGLVLTVGGGIATAAMAWGDIQYRVNASEAAVKMQAGRLDGALNSFALWQVGDAEWKGRVGADIEWIKKRLEGGRYEGSAGRDRR